MGHGNRRRSQASQLDDVVLPINDVACGALPLEDRYLVEHDEFGFALAAFDLPSDDPPQRTISPPREENPRAYLDAMIVAARAADIEDLHRDDNRVSDRTLQPDKTLGATYTRWNGTTGRKGGGGSDATGKSKPAQRSSGSARGLETARTEPGTEFNVYGLTRGVREYYFNRPLEARATLVRLAARIMAEETFTIPADRNRARGGERDLVVYDLPPLHRDVLKIFAGSARVALEAHALENDGPRIKARDAVAA